MADPDKILDEAVRSFRSTIGEHMAPGGDIVQVIVVAAVRVPGTTEPRVCSAFATDAGGGPVGPEHIDQAARLLEAAAQGFRHPPGGQRIHPDLN